jgi:hypothetical protein
MAKFRITWLVQEPPEEVEADDYKDEGNWITFSNSRPAIAGVLRIHREHVLRVRQDEVKRIEKIG